MYMVTKKSIALFDLMVEFKSNSTFSSATKAKYRADLLEDVQKQAQTIDLDNLAQQNTVHLAILKNLRTKLNLPDGLIKEVDNYAEMSFTHTHDRETVVKTMNTVDEALGNFFSNTIQEDNTSTKEASLGY